MAMERRRLEKKLFFFSDLYDFAESGPRKRRASGWREMRLPACPQNLWISLWESWVNRAQTCAAQGVSSQCLNIARIFLFYFQ
jgi:hypothetical protein